MTADPQGLMSMLTQRGYSPVAAAGILGNLQTESGFDPNASGDNGTSFGLAQWHADRKQGLLDYAKSSGVSPSDPAAQIGYLDQEIRTKYPSVLAGLQSASTPQDAATAFLGFERPQGYSASNPMGAMGAQQRLSNAASLFSGQSPGSAASAAGAPGSAQPAPTAQPQSSDALLQLPQAASSTQQSAAAPPQPNLGLSSLGQLQSSDAQRRQQLAGLLSQFMQGIS